MTPQELIKSTKVDRRGRTRALGVQFITHLEMPPEPFDDPDEAEKIVEQVLREGLHREIFGKLRMQVVDLVCGKYYYQIPPEARTALLALFEP